LAEDKYLPKPVAYLAQGAEALMTRYIANRFLDHDPEEAFAKAVKKTYPRAQRKVIVGFWRGSWDEAFGAGSGAQDRARTLQACETMFQEFTQQLSLRAAAEREPE
jgi:hypothetical protein